MPPSLWSAFWSEGKTGTGETMLALEIAKALSAPLFEWHVISITEGGAGPLTNTTQCRDCATASLATHACRTSATTSAQQLWMRSSPTTARSC